MKSKTIALDLTTPLRGRSSLLGLILLALALATASCGATVIESDEYECRTVSLPPSKVNPMGTPIFNVCGNKIDIDTLIATAVASSNSGVKVLASLNWDGAATVEAVNATAVVGATGRADVSITDLGRNLGSGDIAVSYGIYFEPGDTVSASRIVVKQPAVPNDAFQVYTYSDADVAADRPFSIVFYDLGT